SYTPRILILEKREVGNREAASFSLTRSIRSDYLDPLYARLAKESLKLWREIERRSACQLIILAGCLNIAHTEVTPHLAQTYAAQCWVTLQQLDFLAQHLSKPELTARFPQFQADVGVLDTEGGVADVQAITKTMTRFIAGNQTLLQENVEISSIRKAGNLSVVTTNNGVYQAEHLIITAGLWTNEVLERIQDCGVRFSVRPDRPRECKYVIPPRNLERNYYPDRFPVFAYLDVGIYGHPLLPGKTPGVKIGFYRPPEVKIEANEKINSIADFVRFCLPALANAPMVDVRGADQCSYDMTPDNDFIVGGLPDVANIYVAAGWNGTGYKFAPLIGKILTQLVFKEKTQYDLARFDPRRFVSVAHKQPL
ncbi:MAG: FAD-dependent oxidoreductase, partial [bacterium]